MAEDLTNPWVRVDLDNGEALPLFPSVLQERYTAALGEIAAAGAALNEANAAVYAAQERFVAAQATRQTVLREARHE